MYPPTHPAIQSAQNGPFSITVLPDALLINGRGLAKPEPSAGELAAMLHQHLVGELTLFDRLDNGGWHAFLSVHAPLDPAEHGLDPLTFV